MGHQDFSGHTTGLGISPRPGTSERITEGAERCLRQNAYLALKPVSCECCDGVLTLRGFLPTYYLKQLAHALVVDLEGVEQIINEIEVVDPRSR
ncbi:MAG: BON domain-containing protein [Gemmataceae bacterium]